MDETATVARNILQHLLDLPRREATRLVEQLAAETVADLVAIANETEPARSESVRAIARAAEWQAQLRDPHPIDCRRVRIRGEMNRPLGSGPSNGMYALQAALKERIARDGTDWIEIGGAPGVEDLIWFWNWQDTQELLAWSALGLPYVCGPNVLFELSWQPASTTAERCVCQAGRCRAIFTESRWYERLIRAHLGRRCREVPIVLWPYPIRPGPGEPVFPPKWDLLIIDKLAPRGLAEALARQFSSSTTFNYGSYSRPELFEAARRSRCCAYLSTDDRGPLALAEVMLAGCPAAGIEGGAPWCGLDGLGLLVGTDGLDAAGRPDMAARSRDLSLDRLLPALEELLTWDRLAVRAAAEKFWDEDRICDVVIAALDRARRDPQ